MLLWIVLVCLLYGFTLFKNGPNTEAPAAQINIKNISIWRFTCQYYVGTDAECLIMPRLPSMEKFRGG